MARFIPLLTFLIAGSALANQTVSLKAGASATLERMSDTTDVTCEAQAVPAKCLCVQIPYYGFSLLHYPERAMLGTYKVHDDCETARTQVPECK